VQAASPHTGTTGDIKTPLPETGAETTATAEEQTQTPLTADIAAPLMDEIVTATHEPAVKEEDEAALTLAFNKDSWVEIYDRNNETLDFSEHQSGSRAAFKGQPPFRLVIGNAHYVSVYYNDREVDLDPHIRASVARLTLP